MRAFTFCRSVANPVAWRCVVQRQVIAGHPKSSVAWTVPAAAGGRLTDGMGSGGHNVSGSGQDSVVVQAAAGAGQWAPLE